MLMATVMTKVNYTHAATAQLSPHSYAHLVSRKRSRGLSSMTWVPGSGSPVGPRLTPAWKVPAGCLRLGAISDDAGGESSVMDYGWDERPSEGARCKCWIDGLRCASARCWSRRVWARVHSARLRLNVRAREASHQHLFPDDVACDDLLRPLEHGILWGSVK